VLAAIALVLMFASALSWAWIALGLVLHSPSAVMSIGLVILFPVTFMSNIIVDPATMPGWLRGVSDVNPVSHLVTATRTLMAGTATMAQVLWAVAAARAMPCDSHQAGRLEPCRSIPIWSVTVTGPDGLRIPPDGSRWCGSVLV